MDNPLSGRYFISMDEETQAAMEMMGKSAEDFGYLEFTPEGAFAMLFKNPMEDSGQTINGTYVVEDGVATLTAVADGEAVAMKATVDGDKITMDFSGDGSSLTTYEKAGNKPPVIDEPGESGEIKHELMCEVKVAVTLPETGWCVERNSPVSTIPQLTLYNVPSLKRKGMFPPGIEIKVREDKAFLGKTVTGDKSVENLTTIANKTIGGVEMTGISYYYNLNPESSIGWNSIDYIGVMDDFRAVSVIISGNIDSDVRDAILDSIAFSVPEPQPKMVSAEHLGVTVSATIPAKGWCADSQPAHSPVPRLYLYNAPDPQRRDPISCPEINIAIEDDVLAFNTKYAMSTMGEMQDVSGKTIGGIEMTGRTLKPYAGMHQQYADINRFEYIGKTVNDRAVCVQVTNLDPDNDLVKTILGSITFVIA